MTSTLRNLLPTPWIRPLDFLLPMLETGTLTAARLWPGDGRGVTELSNKVEAFAGFREGCDTARMRRGTGETYRELWMREGAGYAVGERFDGGDAGWEGGERVESLPRHTGLGLSVASRLLTDGTSSPSRVIERFVALIERAVPAAARPAALENLGFGVRMLRPEHLADYDRLLGGRDPELLELFWHGAGRGLYFAPTELVPSPAGRWSALDRSLQNAPHELARRNGVAGLAWALTLVNVRHPEVVEGRLRALAEHREAVPWAAHGLASALIFWCSTTDDRETPERFLGHPGAEGESLWRRDLAEPARTALTELLPRLEREGRIAELFRYRPDLGVGAGIDREAVRG